jgi:predicted dehydrogenase
MSARAPLSIGIVGAGEVVRRSHLPVLANLPDARVIWICDSRHERAKAIGKAYGIPAVRSLPLSELPKCDVALLAIPVDARRDYLWHFAQTGTAVLCEKPFAMTAQAHLEILKRFPPHALGCGFMRRFYRSTALLRHMIAAGTLGPPRKIQVSEGNRSKGSGADSSFLDDSRLRGVSRGVLMDLGSHSLDLALYVCGVERFEITSTVKELDGAVDRKVAARATLHRPADGTDDSVELDFSVSWLDRQTNQIRIRFDHATVWSELAVAGNVYLGDPNRPGESILLTSPLPGATTFNQAFHLEWTSFLDGIRERRESVVSARSALLTTDIAEQLLAAPDRSRG